MKRQARMRDVAKLAGVATMTVSRVLSGTVKVSDNTRARVLEAISKLNYRPNEIARSLREQRTWTVGLVVPDLTHPFFAQIAKALATEIRKHGYSLIITSSLEDPELEKQEIEHLLARRVDVMIIASCQSTVDSFLRIQQHNIPYILIDRRFTGLAANYVGFDDINVGSMGTEHLFKRGCRRIAHICGPQISTTRDRIEGFQRALASHHLVPAGIVSSGTSADDRGVEGGYSAMKQLLNGSLIPDGVFCFNDPTASGAMLAILDAGMRIPEDIALVGVGNHLNVDLLRVPLTSIDLDCSGIGALSASMLLGLINSKEDTHPKAEFTTPKLVERASSLH